MQQAFMGGPGEAFVADVADPVVADNYTLIKVHTAPLCTEHKGFQAGGQRRGFGHEASGEVVAIGDHVRSVAVGDRVAVMPQDGCGVCELCTSGEHIYCQSKRNPLEVCGSTTGRERVAQYTIQQDWLLLPIPEGISHDHASMACCGFGPAFNAMQSMQVVAGDTVVVSGLGPVGLGAITVALYRGARVLALDVSAYRRQQAVSLGAELAFDPGAADAAEQILAATGGRGVAKSVETSGADSAPAFLAEIARPRGRLSFIGWGGPVTSRAMIGKGLRLYGCWHWNHQNDADRMLETIRGSAARIDQMVTHHYPMTGIGEALATQLTGECGKVFVHPWQD